MVLYIEIGFTLHALMYAIYHIIFKHQIKNQYNKIEF